MSFSRLLPGVCCKICDDARPQCILANIDKIDKEKARSKKLEQSNAKQQTVLDKLTSDYQAVTSELASIQASRQSDEARWQEERRRLTEDHERQLAELGQREETYASRVHGLQTEVEELLEEQAAHEKEYREWEDEKEALVRKCDETDVELRRANDRLRDRGTQEEEGRIEERAALAEERKRELRRWEEEKASLMEGYNGKNEELQRAMDDLEQLNVENTEYLQRIEEFEREVEAMREEASVSVRSR